MEGLWERSKTCSRKAQKVIWELHYPYLSNDLFIICCNSVENCRIPSHHSIHMLCYHTLAEERQVVSEFPVSNSALYSVHKSSKGELLRQSFGD